LYRIREGCQFYLYIDKEGAKGPKLRTGLWDIERLSHTHTAGRVPLTGRPREGGRFHTPSVIPPRKIIPEQFTGFRSELWVIPYENKKKKERKDSLKVKYHK
jgi:hypothetical protein